MNFILDDQMVDSVELKCLIGFCDLNVRVERISARMVVTPLC